jgi:hypothetical protein
MLSAQSILWHVIDRSWTSTFVAPITLTLLVWRTIVEDGMLQRDLPGYADYAARVPYRLVLGIRDLPLVFASTKRGILIPCRVPWSTPQSNVSLSRNNGHRIGLRRACSGHQKR